MLLEHIRIVLVEPSHPGNIGAAARAMLTMGLRDLVLVSPLHFPDEQARALASGALSVLENAKVVTQLDEAIADCDFVIATSARERSIPWPLCHPREMAERVFARPIQSRVAIVFGRERSGLNNEELHRCHLHVNIPTNAEYQSLNLAAAVQVLCYELRCAHLNLPIKQEQEWDVATAKHIDVERFFEHLERVLRQLDFLKIDAPRQLMTRFRRLFLRTGLDEMEVNMLRGWLRAIEEQCRDNT